MFNNIYKDEEIEENSTCAKIAQVQKETKHPERNKQWYNYLKNLNKILLIDMKKLGIKWLNSIDGIIEKYKKKFN